MKKCTVIFCEDREECKRLCSFVKREGFKAVPVHELSSFISHLGDRQCLAAVIDLNARGIDNGKIRELTLKHPGVYFLGLTKHRLNPEFKESICYHIYACLTKPVDTDELVYWLRSIHEEDRDGRQHDQ
ncbi:MAG: hypothetical protein JRJ03_15195 [Deltaproteobacteria bacterium]|nr:hypothetical protein [Deltaproteobacteria bacterium]